MNIKNQRGQGLIEYVILVALVGVATMGMVRLFSKNLRVNMANVVHALTPGHHRRHEQFEQVDERRHLKNVDFSNFMDHAQGSGHDGPRE